MFESVLVANRGEIAVRVIRTLRELGVRSIAVFSDADAGARHVAEADQAVRLGPAPARESYLSIERVIEAAVRSGASAVHPGYGFLSENATFAHACASAGLVFVGPPASAVEIMGDKISAKQVVSAAGVPVVPGRFEPGMTDADLVSAASEVGYPVLVKPAAGGGGKGMRLVTDPDGLAEALVSARREALSSFGDDTLFVERFVNRPRHIEVQVLADSQGTVIHLGERECSLQRRHQKIIEEAPSVLLDPATRARIGASAVETARSVGYLGAGTVEFIVSADRPDEFFFLEMNTRLQVEHPVTELVTGLDLVAEQLRIAAGEPLRLSQDDVRLTGHAIEARVYAEDPARGFLPTGGRVLGLREPVDLPGVRVDSGLRTGTEVGSWYDPMLSKIIAWGPDRPTALARLRLALGATVVLGVGTNLAFLGTLLDDPEVVAGRLDTQFVDRELARLIDASGGVAGAGPGAAAGAGAGRPDSVPAVYGLVRLSLLTPAGRSGDLWSRPSGWRLGEARPLAFRIKAEPEGSSSTVLIQGSLEAATIRIGDGKSFPAGLRHASGDAPDGSASGSASGRGSGAGGAVELLVTLDGVVSRWWCAVEDGPDPGRVWLFGAGRAWAIDPAPEVSAERAQAAGLAEVRSPMPGAVLAVNVKVGDPVRAGQPLLVVEAMKMEYSVTAARDGIIAQLLVAPGDQVTLNQLLASTD
jgi:acetyl-CoA/propionyl-CoA carboxylase biotin carboxyl carrier protein